jgi:signal transduction histidine kinase
MPGWTERAVGRVDAVKRTAWSHLGGAACWALRWLDAAARAPAWVRVAAALGVTIAAMPIEEALAGAMGVGERSLRIAEAVAVLAGVVAGFGPGVMALGLAVVFTLLSLPPPGVLWASPIEVLTTAIFAGVGLLAITVAQAWQNARRRAERALAAEQWASASLRAEVGRRVRLERMLNDKNEELTRFSHIVAHDLKEPLRGIVTLSHFLEEDLGPTMGPRDFELLERLKALPVRLTEMIDALLVFAEQRPGDGTPKRPRVAVGMVEAAGEAVEVLGPWLAERHAVVEVDPGLPPAHCERPLAARVMCNLIANGVKYNRSPSPRVWVSAREGEVAGGAGVGGRPRPPVYCVSDNGIGIAAENREKVFEMFRRLHGREEFGGGTGSGLALSRRMVERMGGKMWIEDAPKQRGGDGIDGPGVMVCFTLEPDPGAPAPRGARAAGAGGADAAAPQSFGRGASEGGEAARGLGRAGDGAKV